jgi:hypothetical protein
VRRSPFPGLWEAPPGSLAAGERGQPASTLPAEPLRTQILPWSFMGRRMYTRPCAALFCRASAAGATCMLLRLPCRQWWGMPPHAHAGCVRRPHFACMYTSSTALPCPHGLCPFRASACTLRLRICAPCALFNSTFLMQYIAMSMCRAVLKGWPEVTTVEKVSRGPKGCSRHSTQ